MPNSAGKLSKHRFRGRKEPELQKLLRVVAEQRVRLSPKSIAASTPVDG